MANSLSQVDDRLSVQVAEVSRDNDATQEQPRRQVYHLLPDVVYFTNPELFYMNCSKEIE